MEIVNPFIKKNYLKFIFYNFFSIKDYGKLLEYKLKKWGVDTEYIEMNQLHNNI